MEGFSRWVRENGLYGLAMFYLVAMIGGVMSWVFLHTRETRTRARMPGWLGTVAFFAWFEWALTCRLWPCKSCSASPRPTPSSPDSIYLSAHGCRPSRFDRPAEPPPSRRPQEDPPSRGLRSVREVCGNDRYTNTFMRSCAGTTTGPNRMR
jgi:hypothetical protein